MEYNDLITINLADLAEEIGDYEFAFQNYTKVLDKLRNHKGDSLQSAIMESGIIEKIGRVSKKVENSESILKFDKWLLTKSSFVKGNQCAKYLYLDKHKKFEKTPVSLEKQMLFNQGHFFEEMVREQDFPGGLNVKEKVGNFAYFNSYSHYLLSLPTKQTIYEATIIEDQVLVMCDVLIKNEDGAIHVYEIKLNSELNDAIIADLTVQYFICKKRFASNLKSFNLILRTAGENKPWKIENLTDELEKNTESISNKITAYKAILQNTEPAISMGDHCNKPYECEFIEYCRNRREG